MSVASRLKIKYGLPSEPSLAARKQFKKQAQANINSGRFSSNEAAGRSAAMQVFTGFETHVYASESDTLEMLLRQIED